MMGTTCALSGGFMGYGWIFQLLILLLFFGVLFWLLKNPPQSGSKEATETPLEILKKRLAKGEITKKEYESLKKELLE